VTDDELMLRVRDGACEQLGVLFDRHHVPLFSFFCRLTNDRTLAEDLVQEAFYRILKYRRSYKPGMPFRTWMYQIARNARTDLLRKQRDEVDLDAAPDVGLLPADPVEISQLHQALLRLPEEKREILILSRYQEMKYEEIAALLGITIGTVKVRVHRALKELRAAFHKER
jgi:RNA polymerase sigma factor (sigma-70 family)